MTRAHPRTEVVSVFLRSSRGIEGLDIAKVPAAKPLSLEIDLSELPAFPHYRLEVVNSMGKPVWQTPVAGRERRISQPLTTGLAAGQYYVRLYNPSGELLREFGLRVD